MGSLAAPRKMGLVVAMDLDSGIAKNGKIPWRLRKDVEFFKSITSATSDSQKRNAVVMGRKCWESIPEKFRPLKDRLNIVISRTMEPLRSKDLIVANDFEAILRDLSCAPFADGIETVWNIGGVEIYRWGLERDLIDKLIVTKIDKRYETDLIMEVDWMRFSEVEDKRQSHDDNGTPFTFHFYERLAGSPVKISA